MIRRTEDGAEKCALRDFRRDDDTADDFFIEKERGTHAVRLCKGEILCIATHLSSSWLCRCAERITISLAIDDVDVQL